MKYLVLSDVHADIAALERVLEHAGRRGWDAVVSLGDTVGYGAEANAALDRLQALEPYVSLRGNHEAVLLQLLAEPALRVPPNYETTRAQAPTLSEANRLFTEQTVLTHLDKTWGAVHGALRTPWEYLISAPVARANEPLMQRRLYLVGHTHIPAVFTKNAAGRWYGLVCRHEALSFTVGPTDAAFINPGSAGKPRDGLGLSYGLFDDTTGQVTLFRLPLPDAFCSCT